MAVASMAETGPEPGRDASAAPPVGGGSVERGFGSSEVPLAALHDVALLDLDGVVYVGAHAVPHAAASLAGAEQLSGMRAGFVTNNAARPPAVVAEHLVELGIPAAPEDVVTSAQAGARVLAERLAPGARVLAVGGPGVGWALSERGLVPVRSVDEDPIAVVQGYGPDVGWRELAEASLAIERGLLWVATNLDRTIPSPRGRVLGNGSLVAALRHATGVDPVVAGKPEPPLMLESVERTRSQRPLVVGDRLDTDIEGATRSGIPSLLVLTGVTDWEDLIGAAGEHRPTYLAHDLRALLDPAPHVTVSVGTGWLESRSGAARARVRVGRAGVDDTSSSRGPGTPTDQRAGAWWVPDDLRTRARAEPGAAPEVDLEAARALVALAWTAADRGWEIQAPAEVDRRR
jgi:glycerol 3-phosphatase-2